ncbi:MAG TPA: Gfo/Idh/MocA family oxidoreductase [Kiritimatiellia bacterium]|nr:Gfo/Idh/MocA family oxidoreductase [Kiritimatiellia bacterium]
MNVNRRNFLRGAAAAGAPFILPSHIWSAEVKPNDRPGMGFIGMGKQMRGLLGNFLHQDVQCLAVCDVDTTRRDAGKKTVDDFYAQNPAKGAAGCKAYVDFRELLARKDIDLVCIATPDHWHTVQCLAALRAGKDIYCEKPLTHNVHEAITLMREVESTKRILQTGSMQRSSKEFRVSCELVQNGVIGNVERVECQFGDPGIPYDLNEEPMEPGLDWDLWLGPAQKVVYNSTLSPRGIHTHFPHWRKYREFGGGMVTDWGAHHLDIAQWGLGMDASGPVEIRPPEQAGAKRGAMLVYANGVTVTHKDGFGVHFFGTEGEVQVNRGKFTLTRNGKMLYKFTKKEDGSSCEAQVALAEREFLKEAKTKLYVSKGHIPDFLNSVKTRQKPITNETVGGRSAICCHLMNQAYYHHAKILWDPAKLCLRDGSGDPAWLTRDYRAPFKV